MGLATAVLYLRPPEEDEADDQDDDRPERAEHPQAGLGDHGRAVGAVEYVPLQELVIPLELQRGRMRRWRRRMVVRRAQRRVIGLGARRALPLRFQQRVPGQRDVD